jgi:ureidoglycolate hydrolase
MNKNYIEVSEYTEEGYKPLVDYKTWRVAVLNSIDELLPEQIKSMQKHNETDEIFVLLSGKCILFSGGASEDIGEVDAIDMEPLKIYNVKQSVWHTHTLSIGSSVLIIENSDTGDKNSPVLKMNNEQIDKIKQLVKEFWK